MDVWLYVTSAGWHCGSSPLTHRDVIACVSSCAVDVTVYHDGYHGDLNETVFVGKVDEAGRNLVQVA